MNVLGISCYYHDAAACIVTDGKIQAAAMEERFSRVKHDTRFPLQAINACLDKSRLDITEVDSIAFYENPRLKLERILHMHLETYPESRHKFLSHIPGWILTKLPIRRTIMREMKRYIPRCPILCVNHHDAHAASSFYCSGFDQAAIVTVDGVGEYSTTACGVGKEYHIRMEREIRFPHSLGLLYATFTQYLGFRPNSAEYKVMGLSAYGDDAFRCELNTVLHPHTDGSFSLDTDYFDFNSDARMYGMRWLDLFGPPRLPDEPIAQRHMDMAASLQRAVERALINLCRVVCRESGASKLCLAGGVALNSVANAKILLESGFEEVFIPPAPGDDGGAIGAALIASCGSHAFQPAGPRDVSLGPAFSQDQIDHFCEYVGIRYIKYEVEEQLLMRTAALIAEGKVIGWFQDGMEWGPRSLGYRSILADPRRAEMKEILNVKVKHREEFRPFAPSIIEEYVHEYFEIPIPVPEACAYMLMVFPIRESKRDVIPAVVHVDGTGRLHAVSREKNPLYHSLISRFHEITGVPVIVNTSFNVRGEPIVCNPQDAFHCMINTEIDFLVMGRTLISRSENLALADRWNWLKSVAYDD